MCVLCMFVVYQVRLYVLTVTPIRMNVLVRFRATSNNIGENREQINIIALS